MKLNKICKSMSVVLLVSASIGGFSNVNASNLYNDKIHFIPVGSGDAILIESNGKFALVDGGEDSDNPRGFKTLEHGGYEKVLVDYIKNVAGDKNGNVELEYIVGTHAHSDHLGGLDTVVNDNQIKVKKAYIKVYDESKIKDSEVNKWDNKEVYEQLITALKKEKASIVQNISNEPFKFGDFTVQFYNTEYNKSNVKTGENENSLGLKVVKGNQSVFLAGDINNYDGDEDRLATEIKQVDVLKLGHHGYAGSSNENWLNTLKPKYSIATNWGRYLDANTTEELKSISSKVYATMDNNGVVLTFGKNDFGLNNYSPIKEWVCKDGKWYYKNEKNEYTVGWSEINWKNKAGWYYFDKNGVMQTGWIKLDNKWYYLNEESDSKGYRGEMLTGWQQLKYNGKADWYYFDKNGAMQTGWIKLDNKWYYLNEKSDSKGYYGAMLTGRHMLEWNGKYSYYTFDSSGALV